MRCAINNRNDNLSVFETRTAPHPVSVRRFIADTISWLTKFQIDAADLGNVEIVLAEALNNIVEHSQMGGAETIGITIKLTENQIICSLRDSGIHSKALCGHKIIRHAGPEQISDLPEGGFGISLIQAIALDIEYFPVEHGNLVALTVPLTTNPVQI